MLEVKDIRLGAGIAKMDKMLDIYLVGAALVEGGTVQRKESVNRAETAGQNQEAEKANVGKS